MSRRLIVVGVASSLALAAAPAAAQAPGRTLTFKERNKGATFKFIDTPPKVRKGHPPSAGDMFVIGNPLVSATGARRGTLRATCTFASTRAVVCYGVFALKEGQLVAVVSTGNIDAKTVTGTIVGGTAAYAGARGTFSSTSTKTGANDTVTLAG